jgi:hypothetical protein
MIITVSWDAPDTQEKTSLDFKFPPLLMSEAKLFQAATGKAWSDFPEMLDKRDIPTVQFAVWLAHKRNDLPSPAKKMSDIDIDLITFNASFALSEEEQARVDAENDDDPNAPFTSDEEGSGSDTTP